MTDLVLPPPEKRPVHIGIIMDGNGRWAIARGLPRLAGHRAGVENLRRLLRACVEFGIPYLTIYAFSTENWGRPPEEIKGLMFILDEVLERELHELHKEGVQLHHMGSLEGLAPSTQKKVQHAIELTKNNTRLTLNVAFNYGGRAELITAMQRMLRDRVNPDDVNEAFINRYLYTAGQPDPDLIIRTAGELRISNFLLWQAAYAEYYAADVFWPDFDREQLLKALDHFAGRERRFGLTSAQIQATAAHGP